MVIQLLAVSTKQMIQLNEIESNYLNLIGNKISVNEFENWVYKSNWLEDELTEDEYIDLISLNYKTSSAKYEIGKILKRKLDNGKFETVKMINLLNTIIERDGKEGEALTKMYDLYCKGYYFLEDLGLGIGLHIEIPNKFGVEYYHELNDENKNELVDSVYPSAKELAKELKNWLLVGDIKLSGEREPELNRWQYIDNRTTKDKVSRVWKVSNTDKQTGEIRSKKNLLMDNNGDFKREKGDKESWIKRLFKKKKPNR